MMMSYFATYLRLSTALIFILLVMGCSERSKLVNELVNLVSGPVYGEYGVR